MFRQAIVRRPCPAIINGLTSSKLGIPDYQLTKKQHMQYIDALVTCGLRVHIMEPDNKFPDSTFIEDTALITPYCAIITRPGAPSRKGEIKAVAALLEKYFNRIERIESPGTVEAGDIIMVGSHYYIGLSERTNEMGANQVIEILHKYNLNGSLIPLEHVLHLKTGVSYLENKTLLVSGEFINKKEFRDYNLIQVDDDENYAANSIWVNDRVIMPQGFPKTQQAITSAGYDILTVDMSEFRKIDGGVSCLSLRF